MYNKLILRIQISHISYISIAPLVTHTTNPQDFWIGKPVVRIWLPYCPHQRDIKDISSLNMGTMLRKSQHAQYSMCNPLTYTYIRPCCSTNSNYCVCAYRFFSHKRCRFFDAKLNIKIRFSTLSNFCKDK